MALCIKIISVGTKCPSWINEGYQTYAKRLTGDMRIELIEVDAAQRPKKVKSTDQKLITKCCDQEGEKLLSYVKPNGLIIALDQTGKQWSTKQFAEHLKHWQLEHQTIYCLVGGPNGHSKEVLKQADHLWSLSPLTFPHPLVRILLAEQIFRGWCYLNGHPYHK